MNIIVFGATGSIGQQLLEQGLADGHTVTAFIRTPSKMTISHPNLTIAQGDVFDSASVKAAIKGHDAVFITLGAGKKLTGDVRSAGTRNIIAAMEATGIRRLICQTTLGMGDTKDTLNFYWRYLMFGGLLRGVYADHTKQEAIVKASTLDWTLVRPSDFTDEPLPGTYQLVFGGQKHKQLTFKINRAEVADFMLNQLSDSTYIHKTPGISH